MAIDPTSTEKYPLTDDFERALVYHSCSSPKFFGTVGHAVDPDALRLPPCKLAMSVCKAINTETGRGPDSAVVVIQRLRRLMHSGKITFEQLEEVDSMLDAAADGALPSEDAVAGEVLPVLKHSIRDQAVVEAMRLQGQHGEMDRVQELLGKADALGKSDTSMGLKFGMDAFEATKEIMALDRLSTGISELDLAIGGGLWRGALGVVVGAAREGKSVFLTQQSAASMLNGLFTLIASFELAEGLVFARLVSCLTGVQTNSILSGKMAEAKMELAKIDDLGSCNIKLFSPRSTTDDLRVWVAGCEKEVGKPVDLLVIDYADKMAPCATGSKESANPYHAMGRVYEELRAWCVADQFFLWTASQKKAKEKGSKIADVESASDSRNKGREADLMITLNKTGETLDEITFNVAKNRMGKSDEIVGPLPTAFDIGRIVPWLKR